MKKTLVRSACWNLLHSALDALFPLVTTAYVSRVLAPEGVGAVAEARNFVSWFTMFALLGIPQYGLREIARREEDTDRLFSELAVLGAVSTAICSAVYFLCVWRWFPNNVLYWIFGLELLLQALNIDWFFRGKEEYGSLTVRSLLTKLITLALVLVLVKEKQDGAVYCLISCLGKAGGYLWNVVHLRKRLTFRGLHIKKHILPAVTMLTGMAAAGLYGKVDITMLSVLGTESSVGFYSSAYKVINIVVGLVGAVSVVFLPRLSRNYHDNGRCGDTVSMGLKAVLLLALPCCVGLILVAEELTQVLFGGAFAPAAGTIRILAVLVLVKGAGDILCYQPLVSAGKERKLIKAYLLASAANMILDAALIPNWGHNGAAAASVLSELVVNGVLLKSALSVAKPKLDKRFLTSLLAALGAMIAAVYLVHRYLEAPAAALTAAMTLGAAAYFAVLLLTNGKEGIRNGNH